MTRYAMVMDTRRCIGCDSCTVACRTWNELPLDLLYCPVITDGPHGEFPHVHMTHIPLICMHCDNPPCTHACPTGASQQREDGIVFVEEKLCIGCGACIAACPYNARFRNHDTGTVAKCDFCRENLEYDMEPHCVSTCHQRARIFGDLDDPNSDVYRLTNSLKTETLQKELGTDPQVFYIFSKGGQG